MKIQVDRHVFEGTALEIVVQMQALAFEGRDLLLADYITFMVTNAGKLGHTLVVNGHSDAARAASVLAELHRCDLLRHVQ